MEWHAHWVRVYAKTPGKVGMPYGYTEQQYGVFPRYNMLKAVLTGIEGLDLAALGTLSGMRAALLCVGETSTDQFTEQDANVIERDAKAEERAMFCAYIRGLSDADLLGVKPLPHRRVLKCSESAAHLVQLRERWGADFPWFPLVSARPDGGEAFRADSFDAAVGASVLREIVGGLGSSRLIELREGEGGCEIALDFFEPSYTGLEGFWFSEGMDWLIYVSHESSITIVGHALLAAIKDVWPGWREQVWTDPFCW